MKQGSRFSLPGPAALRGHRERKRAAYIVAERLIGPRNVNAHARGEYPPSGAALVAYRVHLGIPLHAWFSRGELEAVGIDEGGRKLPGTSGAVTP